MEAEIVCKAKTYAVGGRSDLVLADQPWFNIIIFTLYTSSTGQPASTAVLIASFNDCVHDTDPFQHHTGNMCTQGSCPQADESNRTGRT